MWKIILVLMVATGGAAYYAFSQGDASVPSSDLETSEQEVQAALSTLVERPGPGAGPVAIASATGRQRLEFTLLEDDPTIYTQIEEVWDNDTSSHIEIEVESVDGKEAPYDIKIVPDQSYTGKFYIEDPDTRQKTEKLPDEKGEITLASDYRKFERQIVIEKPQGLREFNITVGKNTDVYSVLTTTDDGSGSNLQSWGANRVFYDRFTDRWYVVFINSASDIAFYSAPDDDLSTWTGGVAIEGTYDYDDFDCVMVPNLTNDNLHCAFADGNSDFGNYIELSLVPTTPYIQSSSGGTQTYFDASDAGRSSVDDVQNPHISYDADGCIWILADYENDPGPTSDEHQLLLARESQATGCGDGIWNGATDTAAGYPINGTDIHTGEPGYGTFFPLGIHSYGDRDFYFTWIDTDSSTSYDLQGIYWDGHSNSSGALDTMEVDLNQIANAWTGAGTIENGDTMVTASSRQAVGNWLYAWTSAGKDEAATQANATGHLFQPHSILTGFAGGVTGFYDHNTSKYMLFYMNDSSLVNAPQNIMMINSSDGTVWDEPAVPFYTVPGNNITKYISSYYRADTCDFAMVWLSNITTSTYITMLSTGRSINCTSYDATPPKWEFSTNETNDTAAGSSALHSLQWTDNLMLDSYVFSFSNGSDSAAQKTGADLESGEQNLAISGSSPTGKIFDDFEAGNGNWSNVGGDTNDWTRDSGGTPSSATGPCSGGSGSNCGVDNSLWYQYVETSSGSCFSAGDTAILQMMQEIDFDSYTAESINYSFNAFGVDIGTLVLQENTTGTWNTLSTNAGNHGTPWFWNVTDLSGLSGTGGLRFHYTCAGSFHGDMTLDNLNISWGGAGLGPTTDGNLTSVEYDDAIGGLEPPSVSGISVTVNVVSYSSDGSDAGNPPDLFVEIYDGSAWKEIGGMGVDGAGEFTLSTTDADLIQSWQSDLTRNIRIKGVDFDFDDDVDRDWINYTDVHAAFDFRDLFTNDTAAQFGGGSWTNVTKRLNSTTGAAIKWKVYANDTYDNWNVTPVFQYLTTGGVVDSCTYTSGPWDIACSDNCVISSQVDVGGSSVTVSGAGSLTINADIVNRGATQIDNACSVECSGGCFR